MDPSAFLKTLLAFGFVLGAVVVLHELGHLLVAKAVGVYCKTFSVGFGPRLLRRRIGETEYVLSAVPLGGYVKMAGEGVMEEIQDAGSGEANMDLDADGDPIPEDRWFSSKSTWARMAVILAGPLMNLLLAFLVMAGLYAARGVEDIPTTVIGEVVADTPAAEAGLVAGDRIVAVAGEPVEWWFLAVNDLYERFEETNAAVPLTIDRDGERREVSLQPRENEDGSITVGLMVRQDNRVGNVKKEGPAWNAGLRRGDVIVSIDGEPVREYSEIAEIINESIDQPLLLEWERAGRRMEATVTPEAAEVAVSFTETRTVGRIYYEQYVEHRPVGLGQATVYGARHTWSFVTQTASFLKALVSGGASGDSVSGPVRIAQFSGEMIRWGFDYLLRFLALFSVNLFLLNLLPVPVLDGGHAVFILYEMIVGKRPNERVQMIATQVGFVMLLLLMAFVITKDVIHVAKDI